jgi:SPX domain protein involved in polyphosphate accumulation
MKFGQYLQDNQFQPWKREYIQYNYLKQYLKKAQLSEVGWTGKDETYFTDYLNGEFIKIKQFILFKTNQIADDMKPERVTDLVGFIQINITGFQKIIKKHNKWTSTPLHLTHIEQQLNDFIKQLSVQTTMQYWVHADNLTEVEALLLFHMPMQQDNEITNTIYFDDDTFSSYSDMLKNKDQAKIMQARWYK